MRSTNATDEDAQFFLKFEKEFLTISHSKKLLYEEILFQYPDNRSQ